MPDYTIKQGESLPVFEGTLKYANGTIAEPESVAFVMRAITAEEQLTLTGTSEVVSKAKGEVAFKPSAADTATAGNFLANWEAKISGKTMTFPTTGYLWVEVEPSLTKKSGLQIVGLPEVRDYLNIPANDHTHDLKIIAQIESVSDEIENQVGAVRQKRFEEWYEGGHTSIALRHPPAFGYGTTPILRILGCSEYRGPIEYVLTAAPTPTQGTVYSEMVHAELGMVVRRTAGGGTYPFWRDPNHPQQSVHVTYLSGQEVVPAGVRTGALEAIRWHYETTMLVGSGLQTVADRQEGAGPVGGPVLPYHALSHLAPYRRPPAYA